MRPATFCTFALLAIVQSIAATTLRVPAEYATIQAGIDAAAETDTVLVAPGTYTGDGNRNIDFAGKNLVLISESGPKQTIINCQGSYSRNHRGFNFDNGEDQTAVVDGFTVRGGQVREDGGGGVYLNSSSPTIKDCIFTDNMSWPSYYSIWWCNDYTEECYYELYISAGRPGGAVACIDASPTLIGCSFIDNRASHGGGISALGTSSPHIHNTTLAGNIAGSYEIPEDYPGLVIVTHPPGRGGGIYCSINAAVTLDHCTLVDNAMKGPYHPWEGRLGFGDAIGGVGEIVLIDCVVAFNGWNWGSNSQGTVVGSSVTASGCDLYGNMGGDWVYEVEDQATIDGNFSLDPRFCDLDNGDYHVNAFSPCALGVQPNLDPIGALGVGCGAVACGDANGDGTLTDDDLQHLIEFYYLGSDVWPHPVSGADMDCDDVVTIADLILLSGYLYGFGPAPCCDPRPKRPDLPGRGKATDLPDM